MVAIDRRVGYLFAGFMVLLVIALARATWLGTVRAGTLQRAADGQQIVTTTIPATRGAIVDRNGVQLALSESADDVIADPFLIKGQAMTDAEKLSLILRRPMLPL